MDAFLEGLGITDAQTLSALRDRFQRLEDDLENTKAELRSSQLSLEHALAQNEDGQHEQSANGSSEGLVTAELQRRLNSVLAERSQLSGEVEFYRSSFGALQKAKSSVQEELQSLKSERDEANTQRSKAEQEVGRLREETERLISLNTSLGTEKVEKHQRLCALEAQLLEEKLSRSRLEKIQTDYKEQVAWLDEQLKTTQDSQRKSKSQMVLDISGLQDQLARETEDKKMLSRELEGVHTANKRLTDRLAEESEALFREREEKITLKHSFQSEHDSLQQLNQQLEEQLGLANTLIQDLENGTTDLKERLSKTRKRLRSAVAQVRAAATESAANSDDDDDDDNNEVSSMNETYASASESNGFSLEQLSSQTFQSLTEKTGEVYTLKKERDELLHRLQKRENDQKALYTTFTQVKGRYEELLPKYQNLTSRFEALGAGRKELEIKNVELERLLRVQRRENGDLAKQVQTKLYTTERQKARADENYTEFADIRELHENYRTVVARLRLMEENQDPEERARKDDELRDALQEIQNLWKTLNGSKEKMQLLVQQRDRLRAMLQSSGAWGGQRAEESSSEIGGSESNGSSSGIRLSGSALVEGGREAKLRKQNETLHQEFNTFKEEQGRRLMELMKQVDQLRERAASSALEAARKASAADFAEQRRLELEESAAVQSKLVGDLQNKIARLNADISKYQHSFTQSHTEKHEMLQKQRQLEKQLEDSRLNLTTTDQRASALEKQNSSLQEESRRLQNFLDAVQKRLTEDSVGAQSINAHLSSDLEAVRGRLANETEKSKGLQREIDRLNKEIEGTRTLQEAERAEHTRNLDAVRLQNAQLTERASMLQSSFDTERRQSQTLAIQLASAESSSDLNTQLTAAHETERFLRASLQTTEETLEELQRRLSATETTLLEQGAARTTETQTLRSTIANLEATIARLRAESGDHSSTYQREAERARTLDQQITELNEQLEQARSREAGLKQDVVRQRELASQASLNYDREVVLHSEKIRELSVLKEENERLAEQATTLRNQLSSLEEDLQSITGRTDREKAALEKLLQESREHAEHFSKHNELLHKQIEQLSERQSVTQFVRSQGIEGAAETNQTSRAQDYQHEIVKHLRREKSIAEASLANAKQENLRTQLYLDQLKRQLAETQSRLEEALQASTTALQTTADHSQLMSEIQQLSLLRESNVTLRNEAAKNLAASQEWQKKYEQKEKAMQPLMAENQALQRSYDALTRETESVRAAARKSEETIQDMLQNIGREQSSESKKLIEESKKLSEENKKLKEESALVKAENSKLKEETKQITDTQQKAEQRLLKAAALHKKAAAELEATKGKCAQLTIDLAEARSRTTVERAPAPALDDAMATPSTSIVPTASPTPTPTPTPTLTPTPTPTPTPTQVPVQAPAVQTVTQASQPAAAPTPNKTPAAPRARTPNKIAPSSSTEAKPAVVFAQESASTPAPPPSGKPATTRAGPTVPAASSAPSPAQTAIPAPPEPSTATPKVAAPAPNQPEPSKVEVTATASSSAPPVEVSAASSAAQEPEPGQEKPGPDAALGQEATRSLLLKRLAERQAQAKRARDDTNTEPDEGEKRQRSQADSSSTGAENAEVDGPPAPPPSEEPAVNDDTSESEEPSKRGGRGRRIGGPKRTRQ